MFTNLDLDPALLRALGDLGFAAPTPIQSAAIPAALAGRDVVACATTGTGKTAAFLLPILQRLLHAPSRAPRALVVAPTRELAAQVADHFERLAAHTRLRATAVFGGVPIGPQLRALASGVDVLVATPGRLLDHLGQRPALLDRVEVLVLDEADRMLDMGFLPDVRRILARVPAKRQTLLFSATMPGPITALAHEIARDPFAIDLERRSAPAARIRQAVYPVPRERKTDLLVELLSREDIASALVFTRTKHRATRLAVALGRRGVPSAPIHGDRSQAQRTQALAAFRDGRIRVLVATDIASRGIDVEKLSHVVNFDVPACAEDYIHRVGRTARAEAAGDAVTFVSHEEEDDLRTIERALPGRLTRAALPELAPAAPRRREETSPPAPRAQARAAGAPAAGPRAAAARSRRRRTRSRPHRAALA